MFDEYLDQKITKKALKQFLKENCKGSGHQYKSYNEYIVFF